MESVPPTRARPKPPARASAIISAIGGGLALLGFFLPWVTIPPISVNGWFLLQHASDPQYGLSLTSSAETYLTFASAIAIMLNGVVALTGRRSSILTNIQVAGALIGISDLILNLVNLNGSQFDLTVLGGGFWLTLVGFILGLIGALMVNGKAA